MIVKAKDSGKI